MNFTLSKQIRLLSTALLLFIFSTQHGFAQKSWQELRSQGANYYDVKKAFMKKNAGKLKEFKRETQKEGALTKLKKADASEKDMEEVLQFMRWSQYVEPRVASFGGDLAAMHEARQQAAEQRLSALKEKRSVSANTGNWTSLGPNSTPQYGGNGRLNAIRAHPTNPNIMFACAPTGGLWRSIDYGQTWAPVTDQLGALGCTDVAFDPVNPSIMYLASGDLDHYDSPSTGIYKSTDGGATWAPTGLILPSYAYYEFAAVIVNRDQPNVVVAAGNGGVFRSTDGGATWAQTAAILVQSIHAQPNFPNVLYASGTGFYKSVDGGATWQDNTVSGGLPTNTQRMSVAVTAADPNYVYVLAAKRAGYSFQGLYRSTDGGATFTLASSTPNLLGYNFDGGDSGGQGFYTLAIAVSPFDKNVVYVGGVNIWKSADGGATWAIQTHWYGDKGLPYVHADIHEIKINGLDIYASCDGGVFKSNLFSNTWTDMSSNLSIAQVYSIGVSSTNPNLIISGHQDNGTNLTTDKSTYTEVVGGDGFQCFIDKTTDAYLYGELYYARLFKSFDGGNNFYYIGRGINTTYAGFVSPWLQDPVAAATIYAGSNNVYQSVNGGLTFSQISNFGSTQSLVTIDVAASNNQYIYAGTSSNLYKTTNGGASWTNITSGLPTSLVSMTNVRVNPNNSNNVYATFASFGTRQVYMTTDGGATWTKFSTGLPAIPADCIVFDKNSALSAAYVGTDLGVYYRDNTLDHWVYFSSGVPGVPVFDLKIFYGSPRKLRAATFGRGIYESDLYISTPPSAPTVSITAPSNNAVIAGPANITLNATASQLNGSVTKVEFYNGGALLGSPAAAPYSLTWPNVAPGNYTLTAKAYGIDNQTAVSAPVSITVTNGVVLTPTVALTSPASGASFTQPATVSLAASASETGGAISKVEFYNGASLLGTSAAAPYAFVWQNVAAGVYTLTATAYDAANKSVVSSPVQITVGSPAGQAADAGISSISSPSGKVALFTVTPVVTLKNYGPAILQSADIWYKVDNTAETVYHWAGFLTPGATSQVSLTGGFLFYPYGSHTFAARTSLPNGIADANPANDAATAAFTYSAAGAANPGVHNAVEYDRLSFSVYPNPARELVTLQIQAPEAGIYKMTVLDVVGKAMQTQEMNLAAGDNQVPVALKGYTTNLYFIQLEHSDQRTTRKLTIK